MVKLPPLPEPAIPPAGISSSEGYYTAEQMQAHYQKGRADALLDAMNATLPFDKVGRVIAAAIGALK